MLELKPISAKVETMKARPAKKVAAKRAVKVVDESNLGPDSIVEYRGMKMTLS